MPTPVNKTAPAHEYAGTDLEAMVFAENYHQWILDLFAPYLGHSIAEVGAGSGNITHRLANGRTSVVAFEPSAGMAARLSDRLQARTDVTVINSAFSSVADNYIECFDSMVYINVLEHIEQDLEEIELARRALKVNGYLCIFVPALEWLYSEFDRSIGHHRRYRLKSLRDTLSQRKFSIIQARYMDMPGILPWWLVMVLLKQPLNPTSTRWYDKLCIPFIRRVEQRVRVPIGKNIVLIAKKLP